MKPAARVLTCLALVFLGTCAVAAEAPESAASAPKIDLAKGAAISASVCAACHTSDGSRGSPANPILQGQHADYLVKELSDFKSGKRANAIMKGMASTLSEADMKNVAAFYASKEAKPGFARNKALATLGEKIYRGGVAERTVPACASCHGPSGAGIPVQYPRLGGQHAEYVQTQLVAFRSGARLNNEPMRDIATKLRDDEIKALADYVAGLR